MLNFFAVIVVIVVVLEWVGCRQHQPGKYDVRRLCLLVFPSKYLDLVMTSLGKRLLNMPAPKDEPCLDLSFQAKYNLCWVYRVRRGRYFNNICYHDFTYLVGIKYTLISIKPTTKI